MASRGEERRGKLRKSPGICKQELIRRCLNGATRLVEGQSPFFQWSERRELKHLGTGRKRKKSSMSRVVAIEMDRAQTACVTACAGL